MHIYNLSTSRAIASTAPPSLNGRELARRLRKLTPGERGVVAHDLISRHNLTRAQAAALTNLCICYVAAVGQASPEERRALARGSLSLSALQHHRRRRPVSEEDVVRIIVSIGAERVYRALDRITAPMGVAAE